MIRDATLRAKTFFQRLSTGIVRRPKTVLILTWIVALVPMIHLTSLVWLVCNIFARQDPRGRSAVILGSGWRRAEGVPIGRPVLRQ
jgi:hypothetical protein